MSPRSILAPLVAVAVIGPLAILVLFGLGQLLAAMGDSAGGTFLWQLGWGGVGLLMVDAFFILLVLAADSLGRDSHSKGSDSNGRDSNAESPKGGLEDGER